MVGSVKSAITKKSSAGVGVYTDYAGYHQAGAGHLKQRMMVPDEDQGLPKVWIQIVNKSVAVKLKEAMA